MRIRCIMRIMENRAKIYSAVFLECVSTTLGTRTQVNTAINGYADR
jgi:hypothetical protein